MTSLLRKPILRSLAFCMPLLAVTAAHAGIIINGTRVIFPGDKNEVTVKLTEVDKSTPGLAKMWLDTGDQNANPDTLKVPFDIMPPAQRIEPGHSQAVRIIFTGNASELPKDRETVFWFNMLDVPPKKARSKTSSTLQFAFDTRIKLFYRPAGLPGSPDLAMKGLKWSVVKQGAGYALKVNNPSPYYVSMSKAELIPVGGATPFEAKGVNMIEPNGTQTFELPTLKDLPATGAVVAYHPINDFGGTLNMQSPLTP